MRGRKGELAGFHRAKTSKGKGGSKVQLKLFRGGDVSHVTEIDH